MLKAIKHVLIESNKIALAGHIRPDGDTTGCCLALADALESIGKEVYLFCQDAIPYNLRFLKGSEKFHSEPFPNNMSFDVVVALDCSDPDRLGEFKCLLDLSSQVVNIDHHISNTNFGCINWVDSKAAAACELVYKLIDYMDIPIDINIATALYTGLSTDTGNFAFSNTTSQTHNIAATLINYGVKPDDISNNIYRNNSLERVKLISKAIDTIELHENGQISTIEVSNDMLLESGAKEEESSGMVDYAKDIQGVELALLFKEQEDDQIKVSMRSKKTIDCSALAEVFGGGGHARAAGCTIDTNLYNAKIILLEEAKKLF